MKKENMMETRKWYDQNITTSALGFGCMRFKTTDGIVDEKLACDLIDYAYQHGVNYFDTAYVYLDGQSEPVLGKALKKYPRDSYYIATKFSIWNFKDLSEAENLIDTQLKNLQTDHIDFYLMHAMNKNRFAKMKEYGLMNLISKWKNEGKIRHIGFSFHDDHDTFMEILDAYPWEFCQIQYNYMDKDLQQGLKGYQALVDRKIPIIVMEPLKGGKLAKFNDKVEAKLYRYSQDSMAKWAFRWVASQPGVKTILSGMNEMSQLEENINIFSNLSPMTKEELNLIDEVCADLKKLEVVGCTKCQYCMPCPVGVNIPSNFAIINEYEMYQNKDSVKWHYKQLNDNKADFSYCVKCRKCVSKCPQMIDIPNELIRVGELVKNIG
jgi:predicted aldo/keto reductase-like oxidoreductase